MSTTIQMADAVVTAMNSWRFSQEFEAQRLYVPTFKLEDMGTLHVLVVPAEVSADPETRDSDQEEHQIQVCVAKRLAKDWQGGIPNALIDPLVTLAQEIRVFFRRMRLPGSGGDGGVCVKTEHRPIYDPNHLREYGQLTSLLTLTFRVVK